MKDQAPFRGAMTALVTPFDRAGKVHEEHLKRIVDFQIKGGIDAIVPCGTTGEASTLEYDEHLTSAPRSLSAVVATTPTGLFI